MSSKIREALSEIIDLINEWRNDGVMEHFQYSQLFDIADNALAEPLRNCDVGTAEEQAERFHSFCESNKQCGDVYSCECCQLNSIEDCELAWSQMPYEEG